MDPLFLLKSEFSNEFMDSFSLMPKIMQFLFDEVLTEDHRKIHQNLLSKGVNKSQDRASFLLNDNCHTFFSFSFQLEASTVMFII